MVRMPRGRYRAKNRRSRTPGNLFPLKHLPDGRIVRAAYHEIRHLDGKMQIANLPGKNGRPDRIAPQLDLENRLGGLRYHVALSTFSVKNASVEQNLIKVETELPSVPRHTPPAPFCQRGTIRRENDDLLVFTWRMFVSRTNDIQRIHSQNRKYRCDMGSSTAGSQRNSLPSALTV